MQHLWISYDLENSPLQIRTNSEVGSNEKVEVWFKTSYGEIAGAVGFHFTSSPQYFICGSTYRYFPTDLPPETDKVWTITIATDSDNTHVVITCNNEEVLVADTERRADCGDWHWQRMWNKDVEQIYFNSSSDTASDYYRPGRCKNLTSADHLHF